LSGREITERILGFGHKNIQAIHPTTLMITKERGLSTKGDCIVVVGADKGLTELSESFREGVKKPNAKIKIFVEAGGLVQQINASGSPKLLLTHPSDIVIRKSDYISERTLAIFADKSSNDLPRNFVKKLQDPGQKIKITLIVYN